MWQTGKIAQMRENVGTWTTPSGDTLYKNNIALENGVQGTSLSKTPKPPYEVGEEIEYQENKNRDGGTRLKIRKAGASQYNGNSGGGGSYNGSKSEIIARQNAMRTAALMLGSGKAFHEYQQTAMQLIHFFENGEAKKQQPHGEFVETRTEPSPFL